MNNLSNVVLFPRKTKESQEGFKGQFSRLSLSDVIQFSTRGMMSLILEIKQDEKEGRIYIHKGNIVHAQCKEKTGVEAFYEIMTWKKGEFQTDSYVPPPVYSITLPWEHLLIEAHRIIDEKVERAPKNASSLETLPSATIQTIEAWTLSHPDVLGTGILSQKGLEIVSKKEHVSLPEIVGEILSHIPETCQALCNLFGIGTYEELITKGKEGSFILTALKENLLFFVYLKVDIFMKALLRTELGSLVETILKGL